MPELTTCDDASAWDAFVSQAADGSVLQSWAWGSFKARHGWRVTRYRWMDAGQTVAAISVLRRDTAERERFAIRSQVYYQDLLALFRERGQAVVYLARHEDELLAGAVMLFYGRKLIYLYGGTRSSAKDRKPGYLLHWRAI